MYTDFDPDYTVVRAILLGILAVVGLVLAVVGPAL